MNNQERFEVRVKNLGKLDDALIRVSPLTVLAGLNNTGKTFFSKTLYSIFDVMNVNYIAEEFYHREIRLAEGLGLYRRDVLDRPRNKSSSSPINDLLSKIAEMRTVAESCSIGIENEGNTSFDPNQEYPKLEEAANEVRNAYQELAPSIRLYVLDQNKTLGIDNDKEYTENYMKDLDETIYDLCGIDKMNAHEFVTSVFQRQSIKNIRHNFQVESTNQLRGKDGDIEISMDQDFQLHINEHQEAYHFKISIQTLMEMQRHSRVIYLDSPALWKIKNALERVRRHPSRFRRSSGQLLGVPDYFYDLCDAMLEKSIGENDFPDVFEHLTKDVLHGSISLSNDTGELLFNENGRDTCPLSATSIGVANLGMLAMLIERKVLNKEAFLFIDEPESNLHPAWQVEMTKALWKLASGGVRVVIATHSVDILKRLEVYAEEEKEKAKELITINHFQGDGKVEIGGVEKILDVKKDLSSPYFELYKRSFQ